MSEWVGLNPTAYAVNYQHVENKQANGVSTAVVNTLSTLNDYTNTFEATKSLGRDVVSIRSFNQQLVTYKETNIALTSFYDKVNMLGSINSEPYGNIKHENADLYNVSVNEVEDIKQKTYFKVQEVKHIDVKLIPDLTLSVPTTLI